MWTYSEEQLAPLVPSGEQNRAMAWAYTVRQRANPELSERRERGRGRRHTLWGIMHRGFCRVDRKGRRCGHTRRDSISKTPGRRGNASGEGPPGKATCVSVARGRVGRARGTSMRKLLAAQSQPFPRYPLKRAYRLAVKRRPSDGPNSCKRV